MKSLPDIIDYHLKIIFIGYNPGLRSAELGHHYAGPSNGFWKLLAEAGLTPRRIRPEEDRQLLSLGLGSVNIVDRPTRGASELTREEFRTGAVCLQALLAEYRPRIACYMGLGVYRVFTGKREVCTGLQETCAVAGVLDYVCSSPSGLNRISYSQQLQCFIGLRHLLESSN
jgi:double-stranded uracil-DNA glycosylase